MQELASQFETAHLRHGEVGNDGIEFAARKALEGSLRIGLDDWFIAEAGQDARAEFREDRLIVEEEDAFALAEGDGVFVASGAVCFEFQSGEIKLEGRALARLAARP